MTPTKRSILVAAAAIVSGAMACAGLMGVEEATLVPVTDEAGAAPIPIQPGSSKQDDDSGSFIPDSGCAGAGCACTGDGDCLDSVYKKCVGGTCQGCSITPTDSCPVGRYCLAGAPDGDGGSGSQWNECAPGCRTLEDCAVIAPQAKHCISETHRCVACKTKADCTTVGQDCSPSGVCSDTCTPDGGTCPNPAHLCCKQFCIDPKSDPLNCMACGNACATSSLCCFGTCANTLTNTAHCGKCGTACSTTNAATTSCTAGSCKWNCSTGFNHCTPADQNTGCETATSASLTQCGSCTTNCNTTTVHATGVLCASSKCDYDSCQLGWANKDNNRATGCETACGASGQACCGTNTCGTDLVCQNNVCRPCGAEGTPCCAGQKCAGVTYCAAADGMCKKCKAKNQPCTLNEECCDGATACHTNNTCK